MVNIDSDLVWVITTTETLLDRSTERIQRNTGIVGFLPSSLLFYVGFNKNR
jgi:hypothetical protein